MKDHLILDDEVVEFEDISNLTLDEIAAEVNRQSFWTATPTEDGVSLRPPTITILGVYSLDRGHKITPAGEGEDWVYEDTREPCEHKRPCIRCGRPPTPEGYDACLGTLPGIQYACCGHGVSKPVRIYKPWKIDPLK